MINNMMKLFSISLLSIGMLTACGDSGSSNGSNGSETQEPEHPVDESKVETSETLVDYTYNLEESQHEDAKTFIKDNVEEDLQQFMQMILLSDGSDKTVTDIKAVGQVEISNHGQTGDIVKVQAEDSNDETVNIYVMYGQEKGKIVYLPMNASEIKNMEPNDMMDQETIDAMQSMVDEVEGKLE
ncbi:hypothetical protein [Lentibacillus salinarum]|uniref:Lipoprotein n=1 Tax=Lentibacillus salinarum TaxID=446820 RepID=A0ABW3ZRY2_9BACI